MDPLPHVWGCVTASKSAHKRLGFDYVEHQQTKERQDTPTEKTETDTKADKIEVTTGSRRQHQRQQTKRQPERPVFLPQKYIQHTTTSTTTTKRKKKGSYGRTSHTLLLCTNIYTSVCGKSWCRRRSSFSRVRSRADRPGWTVYRSGPMGSFVVPTPSMVIFAISTLVGSRPSKSTGGGGMSILVVRTYGRRMFVVY